jgi:predicted ATP-grasp superfamily ATP-dependent carboligase
MPRSHGRAASDALITNGWGRIAYNVVRSLGGKGLRVVVGTDRFLGMSVASRYASATFRHPSFITETTEFVQTVSRALQRYSPRVYLPTGEDAFVAAKYIEQLQSSGVVIPVGSFETIRRLHHKKELLLLAKSLGIPVPETIVPASESDIRAFCRHFGSTVVLKRISSSGARGVYYVTEDELLALWNRGNPELPRAGVVLQEMVRGSGYGVSMLFNRGRLRARFTHKRLRERRLTGGVSILRMGVIHSALETYAAQLFESVHFHGVGMVEFKHDDRSGRTWLLDVNPRFWGSLALAVQSGVDFPYLLYRMAVDGDVEQVLDYKPGLVVKWLAGDMGSSAVRSRPWSGRMVDGYDDLHRDDPLPFVVGSVLSVWKWLATRHSSPEELDVDIEKLASRET